MMRLLAILLALFCGHVAAQDVPTMTSGEAFANSLKPTSAGQLINPAAPNIPGWSANTAVPTSTPSQLGGFSTPITAATAPTNANALGLTALGNSAVTTCAGYTPGPDPMKDQECAAVNFMNNNCINANNTQNNVMGHIGFSQPPNGNCSNTYGAGQANFNFSNTITTADPAFTVFQTAMSQPPPITNSNCTTSTVTTTPAQTSTAICTISNFSDDVVCSKSLAALIITSIVPASTSLICSGGTLVNGFCVSTSATQPTIVYTCPTGQTLSGSQCLNTVITPAIGSGGYSCPVGTLVGSTCVISTSTAANSVQSCPSGTTPFSQFYCGSIAPSCPYASNPFQSWRCSAAPYSCAGQPNFAWQSYQQCGFTYNATYSCPSGQTLSGSQCLSSTTVAATIGTYTCPTGQTLSGSQCINTSTAPASSTPTCLSPAVLDTQLNQCVTTTTTPPNTQYSCLNGIVPVNGLCKYITVNTQWNSTCDDLETSAGITMPTP